MENSFDYGLLKLFPEESGITTPMVPTLPRPPMLQLSSDYPRWKKRDQAFLSISPPAHHFLHIFNAPSEDAFTRADATGFSSTKSMDENWNILDNCFDL
ncbi:unnamed protein product [Trichobilharzia regenti]|nr:unnamed protein product [Trichobilharzia regenti]